MSKEIPAEVQAQIDKVTEEFRERLEDLLEVKTMIELRGKTVALRPLERKDCRHLWQSYEPEEPLPTEPLRPGLSVEGADQWFDEIQTRQGREQVYLGVFTLKGRLVGDIQLANIEWRQRTASIGLSIARREDRGQGYGLDAARTLIEYGFDELDLWRIQAEIVEHNVGARQVLEKLGFVPEGREREAIYGRGRRWDRLVYGLLRPDWTQQREENPQ